MPKVIKIDPPELKVKHGDCGAVISYYENEVQSFIHHDYGGGREIIRYIICPNCGKRVQVR